MTSIRHNPETHTSPDDGYLDAAREAILAVGWSRTTLTDIARRAGVSRMTLYRRWPDTQTLLADLMTREWGVVVGVHVVVADDAAQLGEQAVVEGLGEADVGRFDGRGVRRTDEGVDEVERACGQRCGLGRVAPAGPVHLSRHVLQCYT